MTAEPMFTLQQFVISFIVLLFLMRLVAEIIVYVQEKKNAHAMRQHQHEQNKTIKHYYSTFKKVN